MLGLQRILVAVEQDETARFVLEKAVKLATAANAEVHVIRVIFDTMVESKVHSETERHELKTFLMAAEESWLEDFIESSGPGDRVIESATIWHKDEHVGILDAAKDCGADLVMKASHQPEGIDRIVHTPQDWALLRHSPVPVMLVKLQAWADGAVVLAAIDALHDDQADLNKRILEEAGQLASILGGELDIVVAHPFVQPWIGPNTVPIDFEKVRREVEGSINQTVSELVEAANVDYRYLHIGEGSTANAVGHYTDTSEAELLVMGTVARDGITGLVLGNTSETILYRVQCDIAVLR